MPLSAAAAVSRNIQLGEVVGEVLTGSQVAFVHEDLSERVDEVAGVVVFDEAYIKDINGLDVAVLPYMQKCRR